MRIWHSIITVWLCLTVGIVSAQSLTETEVLVAEKSHSDRPQVALLHGLARSAKSMKKMAEYLTEQGFAVCNIDYPSTEHAIERLAADFVWPAIQECLGTDQSIHFVTHSMGGILVRELASTQSGLNIGRVVMLSPPNHGSEVVDKLGDWKLFQMLNGPAGTQLGTSANSKPNSLGAVEFEVGVITGNRSVNWILSSLIDGDDDGKVSVESAKLEGMADFLIMKATHPFIMRKKAVMKQALHFLQHGNFKTENAD